MKRKLAVCLLILGGWSGWTGSLQAWSRLSTEPIFDFGRVEDNNSVQWEMTGSDIRWTGEMNLDLPNAKDERPIPYSPWASPPRQVGNPAAPFYPPQYQQPGYAPVYQASYSPYYYPPPVSYWPARTYQGWGHAPTPSRSPAQPIPTAGPVRTPVPCWPY